MSAAIDQEPAIRVEQLAKLYRRSMPGDRLRTLKSVLVSGNLTGNLRREDSIVALEGVDFTVRRGEAFGVIGGNGSGKSTLLKLLAGITKPTRGTLEVDGRVSALIELGAGFHPEISGRENVAINGIMLGLTRRQVQERFDEIVAFAELERFIDAPVKTYSSGMYMRLGFAVAIHVDPEVLLIDEVLAVGDEGFTRKCLDKISEFRRRGKTIVLVTHSLGLVEKMCDEALWVKAGRKADQGDPKRVVDAYLTYVAGGEEALLTKEHGQIKDAAAPAPDAFTTPLVNINGSGYTGVNPADYGMYPDEMTSLGNRLVLSAEDGTHGREPTELEPAASISGTVTIGAGTPVDGARVGVCVARHGADAPWAPASAGATISHTTRMPVMPAEAGIQEVWHGCPGPWAPAFAGATGVIGREVVRALLEQGAPLRVFARSLEASAGRPRTRAQFAIGEQVKVVSGPLSDFSGEISEITGTKEVAFTPLAPRPAGSAGARASRAPFF